jgi:glycerol uptake facilitator-like aquaporin
MELTYLDFSLLIVPCFKKNTLYIHCKLLCPLFLCPPISGGHLNPAVSLAMVSVRKLRPIQVNINNLRKHGTKKY